MGRRILESLFLLFAVALVTFSLVELAPGDPVQAIVGDFPATPEYREQITEDFELDEPAYIRFGKYIANVAQGHLGYSFANREEVSTLIMARLQNTLILMLSGLSLAAILGTIVGIVAATSRHKSLDTLVTAGSLAGFSIPVFWLAQILLMIFAIRLGWLPAQGATSLREDPQGLAAVVDFLRHLILPMIVLMLVELGVNARIARASMLQTMDQDYIWTARAKGLSKRKVIYRHALRNSLLPVITVIGYKFGYILSGSILIETVFGWPGVGQLLFDAVSTRDNAVILGVFLITGAVVVLVNFVTDLSQGFLDPRIRQV